MSLNAKYQYTHFIYPFVVEDKNYSKFLSHIVSNEKDWKLKVHNYFDDRESYDFFLPYTRRFLFPTLFWEKPFEKQYKTLSLAKKTSYVSRLSCASFEYELSGIKTGTLSKNRNFSAIDFDIVSINLICFKPGVCFLDIKAEVESATGYIEFDKVLDFNFSFRNMTPRAFTNKKNVTEIKAKNIDNIENIAIFIKSIISGYETSDIEKIYYDKMFTYSYACVDSWETEEDFERIQNDFYKFQYVMDSKSSAVFNKKCDKLYKNTYSRWQYSMFGFSIESGVVLVSDKEKYNITRMPYNFEKRYLYMLYLAFYQRISLINFSQDLQKKDKGMAGELNGRFTKFTHMSWYSQVTNSEHGTDMWENWKNAFKLDSLFDEVHKEYSEYYDFVRASGQEKFSLVLIITYMVNISFSGISLLANLFGYKYTWMQPLIAYMMFVAILSYPTYLISRWLKHKIENKIDNY